MRLCNNVRHKEAVVCTLLLPPQTNNGLSTLNFNLRRNKVRSFCIAVLRGFLQFVGAGHMLVSASHDGTARVWDAWTGECAAVLEGHTGRLNAVATSLDGSVIVSCSDDSSARVWDGNTYNLIRCACLLQAFVLHVACASVVLHATPCQEV